MDVTKLSFAEVRKISDNISEVVVAHAVEVDSAMIDELHAHLSSQHSGLFGLLVNKINKYAYSFAAQQRIANPKNMHAIAVVVYQRSSEISTRAILNMPHKNPINMKIFYAYDEALSWLNTELAAA